MQLKLQVVMPAASTSCPVRELAYPRVVQLPIRQS